MTNWQLGEASKVEEVISGARVVAHCTRAPVESSLLNGRNPYKKKNEIKKAPAVPMPDKPSAPHVPSLSRKETETINIVMSLWVEAKLKKVEESSEQVQGPSETSQFDYKSLHLNEQKKTKLKEALAKEASRKQQALKAQIIEEEEQTRKLKLLEDKSKGNQPEHVPCAESPSAAPVAAAVTAALNPLVTGDESGPHVSSPPLSLPIDPAPAPAPVPAPAQSPAVDVCVKPSAVNSDALIKLSAAPDSAIAATPSAASNPKSCSAES